jgi:CRP/FNR family transcriptional regulator, anaerobic regulatory protein
VLTPVESHSPFVLRQDAETAMPAAPRVRGEEITLAAGDILFQEGDPRRHVYRIETGALCLYRSRPDGGQDVLEFAFPGDLVGIGYLDSHAAAAQATMTTLLSCLPRDTHNAVIEPSARTHTRLTAAIEREVAFLKDALVSRTRPEPLRRIAALFVTLSRQNGYEGREPSVITDSLKCGAVAGHLGMSVDALAQELAELEARGLIEPCDKGLRLLDIDTLLRLADGLD